MIYVPPDLSYPRKDSTEISGTTSVPSHQTVSSITVDRDLSLLTSCQTVIQGYDTKELPSFFGLNQGESADGIRVAYLSTEESAQFDI